MSALRKDLIDDALGFNYWNYQRRILHPRCFRCGVNRLNFTSDVTGAPLRLVGCAGCGMVWQFRIGEYGRIVSIRSLSHPEYEEFKIHVSAE